MKKLVAALLAQLAVCAVLAAQNKPAPSGDEIQIRQLERAWNEAEARHEDHRALRAHPWERRL